MPIPSMQEIMGQIKPQRISEMSDAEIEARIELYAKIHQHVTTARPDECAYSVPDMFRIIARVNNADLPE